MSNFRLYRGETYHLREYKRTTRGPMELINYGHSFLDTVIDLCFSMLKARFLRQQ